MVTTCRADLLARISHHSARLVRYADPLRLREAREGRGFSMSNPMSVVHVRCVVKTEGLFDIGQPHVVGSDIRTVRRSRLPYLISSAAVRRLTGLHGSI